MYMADYSSMKGPELDDLLKSRGVKVGLSRVSVPVKRIMAEKGLMEPPEAPKVKKSTKKYTKPELIEMIKEIRPEAKGLGPKSKDELTEILKRIGTSLDSPPPSDSKPKRPVVKRKKPDSRAAAEEEDLPVQPIHAQMLAHEKEMQKSEYPTTDGPERKPSRPVIKRKPVSSRLTSSTARDFFEKKSKQDWLDEAKSLGLTGLGPKKKDEVMRVVIAEQERIKAEAERDEEEQRVLREVLEASDTESEEEEKPKKKQIIKSSAILREIAEAKKKEPSLDTFKFLADENYPSATYQNLFVEILVAMQLFEILIKRSPRGKAFTLDLEEGPKTIDVKPVRKSLQYYLDEMKKTFAEATKNWKIKQTERSKMRKEAEEAMKTDKQVYDGIERILEGEAYMELKELGDVYYLRIEEDDDQPNEDGNYEGGDEFMGTFVYFEESLDDLEYYNNELKIEIAELAPTPPVKKEPLNPDRIKPLELEEGQDWKTLTLPNKVKYFLSMVEYDADSMGQIERQSQAKMDRFIERARYDEGLDEERPPHYFMDWQGEGWNMFEEDVPRNGDAIPNIQDVKRQPHKKGRFFKGVFTDDGVDYIVNYFGMFAIKDELENEIEEEMENPTRFDWRNLSSWVKYKRFNFWQQPIVLEMTKGPMMIVPVYNIYDIRQSTSGVRPIDGVFKFSGDGGIRRQHPEDFESIQDELVASYTERLEESDDESDEDEERPVSGLPQQEMLSPPVDELEEKMASLSVSSLPPNEQELLPDATPPVEKEKVVEVDITPPDIYDRMGVLLPTGILPPDEDARVYPQLSAQAGDDLPTYRHHLLGIKGDWGLDFLRLTTSSYPDEMPEESGIEWLFATILNREDPTETNFIAAVEDHYESQTAINIQDSGEDAQYVFDINTGELIGEAYLPDEDEGRSFAEFFPKYTKEAKEEKPRPKLKKPRSTQGTKVGRMLAKKKKEKSSVKSGVFSFLTGSLPEETPPPRRRLDVQGLWKSLAEEPRRRPDGTLEGSLA